MFSEKGMKTVPEKDTRNTRNTSLETKNKKTKALQSFLGLTNYMKRFIHDYSTEQ